VALVELSFPARPVHVRTARQVAVALARRAELAEEVLDEVRLAVAEACALALSVLRNSPLDDETVALDFDDSDGLTVEVRAGMALPPATGQAALDVVAKAADAAIDNSIDAAAELSAGASLAVLMELAPILDAATSEQGMRLTLGWPTAPV
jgi:Histidine kinase-like ATPase domain